MDDSTTLEEARKLIHLEFDEVDVPEDFRFVYRGAPCPRKQEPYRFAVECKPCLILAVKPVEGKLRVGSAVLVDGTPGTIERIRKSGRVDVTFPSKPPEKDRKLKNVRRGDLTLPNKQEGAGYAWTTQADDDARRLRDEIRRLRAVNDGPEAVEEFEEEQKKRRRRRRKRRHAVRAGKALRVENEDARSDAEKPAADPELIDGPAPPLDVVAIPLETTASTTQGSSRITLQDDLALFDVTSADVLRESVVLMARRTELRKRMNGSISYQMIKSSSPSARVTRTR